MGLDFGDEVLTVSAKKGFGYDGAPTMSYEPQQNHKVREAYNRHDWRELNRLGVVWYDYYGERWHKFGPHFWDV